MTSAKPELPDYLSNIRIILTRTSHLANIGSAARAMKTMGLHNLTIVAPNLMSTPMTGQPPVFNPENPQDFQLPEESFILASGAADVLHNAVIAQTVFPVGKYAALVSGAVVETADGNRCARTVIRGIVAADFDGFDGFGRLGRIAGCQGRGCENAEEFSVHV